MNTCTAKLIGGTIMCLTLLGNALASERPAVDTSTDAGMRLDQALTLARQSRAELRASAARVAAAQQRPAIVSSLDDPMISPSIDHKPVDPMMGTDRSITIEQRFPLSRVNSHRRRSAEADITRFQGEGVRTALKVDIEVAQAFFMLNERRKVARILDQQIELVSQLVKAAAARHGVGAASQTDVLRLEIEQARLRTRRTLIDTEIRGAELMFNTALGQDAHRPVPVLHLRPLLDSLAVVPELDESLARALERRPELKISKAEIERARAEVDVMKSMYAPMGMVRVGMAKTMTAGRGYMLMVGVSVPIWFGRLKAGVREANEMAVMAEADREAMLRMIHGEVAAAHAALRGAEQNYRAFQSDLLPRSERTIAPALAAFANGSIPMSSVLEANKAWWSVQEEAVMAETALGMAWIRHRGAVGSFGEIE